LFKTNPTKSDSDGDGISDGIEATSKCLNPQANDAMLMDMSMNIINKTGIDTDRDNKTNVQEIKDKTDPCMPNRSLPRGSFFDSLILSRNSSFARTQNMNGKNMTEDLTKTTTMTNPFILVMKKTESNGANSSNNQLEYNAFTKKATFVINGTTTNRQLSVSDENVVQRILNDSGFLDSKSFYPPSQAPNLSGSEYTLITILNGKIHAAYWTDNSPHVPNGLKNLPFILVSTMGDAKLTW
jgi:hypothetical protein